MDPSPSSLYPRRGLGFALVDACCARARRWGVQSIFIGCAAENVAMRTLARAHGMRVIVEGPEADALLALPPAERGTAPLAPATV